MARTTKKANSEDSADFKEREEEKERNSERNNNETASPADESTEEESSGTNADGESSLNADEDGIVAGNEADIHETLAAERDKYLRLAAEYDNYRKRSAKEREKTYHDARADVITKLLPVYDNLERALKAECADEAFYRGVEMTMTGLVEILETLGVAQIKAVGEPFDPNRHNAVMTVENPDLGEKTIAEEFQKGFTLGEKVIRFSTVVVAN